MTEISDDRSWWADVEHLRPDAGDPVPGPAASRDTIVADRPVAGVPTATGAEPRQGRITGSAPTREPEAPARRGRISGRALASLDEEPVVLRRADAASFAQAMDLDGAFGAPVRSAESREIVLSGRRAAETPPRTEERPVARGQGSPDRPTVRITGNPGIHAEIAERRALREIEGRRPRSAAERVGHRPDRIAMWVVLLGLLLVVIAATSSSAGVA